MEEILDPWELGANAAASIREIAAIVAVIDLIVFIKNVLDCVRNGVA
jgi:hypothetical protein